MARKTIKKNMDFNLVEVIIIILITTLVVSVFSGLLVFNNYDKINSGLFHNTSDNIDLSEFIESYEHIIQNYVNEVEGSDLIDAAIAGMYNHLDDDYTMYLNKELTESLDEQLGGEYSGIGVEITMNENKDILINRVFSDSPALEAGLKQGDMLIKLDGVDLSDKDSEYVANTIKQSKKESFDVTYKRDGKENTVTITRKRVYIDSVTSKEYGNVGYIQIETFSGTTSKQIKNKLDDFSDNINSVVIDVRNNSGGYLSAAYEISDLFIEKGKNIYQLKDRNENIKTFKAQFDVYRKFDKIAVLVNEYSASASEILALALKESADATIVGVKSYGKGSVQETNVLSSGAMVKYTTAYWLSPEGNSIDKVGIVPDIEVSKVEKQLDKALEAVK